MMIFDKAARLTEDFYGLHPSLRLGYLKALVDSARAGNAMLRDILTLPVSCYSLKRFPATITKEAKTYCKRFWGKAAADVVHGRCDEPPTGEDGDVIGHTPSHKRETKPVRPRDWNPYASIYLRQGVTLSAA